MEWEGESNTEDIDELQEDTSSDVISVFDILL